MAILHSLQQVAIWAIEAAAAPVAPTAAMTAAIAVGVKIPPLATAD